MKNLDFIQMAFRRNSCVFFTQLFRLKISHIHFSAGHHFPRSAIIKFEGVEAKAAFALLHICLCEAGELVTGSTKRYDIIHINKHSCFLTMFSSKITIGYFTYSRKQCLSDT